MSENQSISSNEEFEKLINSKNPDLSGGIKFINSSRHEGYVDASAIKKEFLKLIKQMGWTEARVS